MSALARCLEPYRERPGNQCGKPKYFGLHSLRHFYASWLINSVEDVGLGLAPKMVQERMGHSGIAMTMDVYGHLFPRGNEQVKWAAAERALLG